MPALGTGSIDIWAEGSWTTQLLDVSLHSDGIDNWKIVKWVEENTSDESIAYVRVDILDSSSNILQSDVSGTLVEDFKQINLSDYANVKGVDIYLKFKLFSKSGSPIVSDIRLT